jgi:hypothetical protein
MRKFLVFYITYGGKYTNDIFYSEDKDGAASLCYKHDSGSLDEDCRLVIDIEEVL